MNEISISLTYKEIGGDIFKDFRKSLENEYIINVKPRPGVAAMGSWDVIVEIILNLQLKDYVMIALGGVTWDILKKGTKHFVLNPLIKAFEKLEIDNEYFDYLYFTIKFQDTDIIVYGTDKLLTGRIGIVMPLLIKHYNHLIKNGNIPHTIFIPISHDDEQKKFINYGGGADFDTEEYQKYWGIFYDSMGYERDVYDLENSKMLGLNFD